MRGVSFNNCELVFGAYFKASRFNISNLYFLRLYSRAGVYIGRCIKNRSPNKQLSSYKSKRDLPFFTLWKQFNNITEIFSQLIIYNLWGTD